MGYLPLTFFCYFFLLKRKLGLAKSVWNFSCVSVTAIIVSTAYEAVTETASVGFIDEKTVSQKYLDSVLLTQTLAKYCTEVQVYRMMHSIKMEL
jgi:hypothetical protein